MFCLNGDLVEVGKKYRTRDAGVVTVVWAASDRENTRLDVVPEGDIHSTQATWENNGSLSVFHPHSWDFMGLATPEIKTGFRASMEKLKELEVELCSGR